MEHAINFKQPTVRTLIMILSAWCCVISCAQPIDENMNAVADFDGAAISFLGDTLQSPVEEPSAFQHKDSLLQEAYAAYEADTTDLDNIIWLGRRLAYLNRYKEAIHVFTQGIALHPEAPELYRHRGHRFITIRQPEDAIEDLTKGITFARNRSKETEPDGIPNKLNIPLSNLHFNLFYHLGLAHYLKGEFREAITAYEDCMNYSDNPDLKVATSYWLYLAAMKAGDTSLAGNVLLSFHSNMEIIENDDYLQNLLFFKGEPSMADSIQSSMDPLSSVTRLYGMSCLMEFKGDTMKSNELRNMILQTGFWPGFGYIAAEADLARAQKKND